MKRLVFFLALLLIIPSLTLAKGRAENPVTGRKLLREEMPPSSGQERAVPPSLSPLQIASERQILPLEALPGITATNLPRLVVGPACGALIGFLLGFVAFTINERAKLRREKRALVGLFIDHIKVAWPEVDSLRTTPTGPFFTRIKMSAVGVEGLNFTSVPEELFPVDDLHLYNAYALRLASLVKNSTRRQLWLCYRLLNKAENSRTALKNVPKHQKDHAEYQKLYARLVADYYEAMLRLHELLDGERGWFH
jgi:hypothetical protein